MMITRDDILALPAELLASRDTAAIAAALSVGRVRTTEHVVSERGIIAALGVIDGEAFIAGLEAFAGATLPDGHPLRPAHPGIARMLRWLQNEGINMGDPAARQMLDILASAGVVTAASAVIIKGLAEEPDPLDEYAVRCLAWSDAGEWQL